MSLADVTSTDIPSLEPFAITINSEIGLSNNAVYSIAEDEYHRIWAATPDGLNIIAGNGITRLKHQNNQDNSLSSNVITKVMNGPRKAIWALTKDGVDKIDLKTLTVSHLKDPLNLLTRVTDGEFIDDEHLLLSANRKLILYNLNSNGSVELPPSKLTGLKIFFIVIQDKKTVILATDKAYYRYQHSTDKLELITYEGIETDEDTRAFFIDSLGRTWISIFDKGIFVFDKQHKLLRHFSTDNASLTSDLISDFTQVDNLLYATTANGLVKFDLLTLSPTFIRPRSIDNAFLTAEMPLTIRVSSNGSHYIGTTNGLFRIAPDANVFSTLTRNKANNKTFLDTLSASKQSLVSTMGKRVNRWQVNGNSLTLQDDLQLEVRVKNSLSFNDSHYFVSDTGQVFTLDDHKMKHLEITGSQTKEDIHNLFYIKEIDKFIFTTRFHLLLAKRTKLGFTIEQRYLTGDVIVNDIIMINELLVIGSQRSGVLSLALQAFFDNQYSLQSYDKSVVVAGMFLDSASRLWVYTLDQGLFMASLNSNERLEFQPFANNEQLLSLNTSCMTEDKQGRLWLASAKGLSMINTQSDLVRNFTLEQGLSATEFIRGNCGVLGDKLFFATHQEAVIVNVEQLMPSQPSNKLNWGAGTVDGQSIAINSHLTLIEPGHLELELLSGHIGTGKGSDTFYRILPGSNKWIYAVSGKTSLVNIAPGNYQLEAYMKAIDGHTAVAQPLRLEIKVPFWRSPFMYMLYILAILLLIVSAFSYKIKLKNIQLSLSRIKQKQQQEYALQLEQQVRLRTKQYKQQQQQAIKANLDKTRFVTAISHDLRAPIIAINLKLKQNKPLTMTEAKQIRDEIILLDGLVESILNISQLDCDLLKPNIEGVELTYLLKQCVNSFQIVAEEKNISLSYKGPSQAVWGKTDIVLVRRILNNLIDNAIKNCAQGQSVKVSLVLFKDSLQLKIKDSGPGIPQDLIDRVFNTFVRGDVNYQGSGLGLAIVKQLAELLNIKLQLKSSEQGSCFYLTIPQAIVLPKKQDNEDFEADIIIVDDRVEHAKQLFSKLKESGFKSRYFTDIEFFQKWINDRQNSFSLLMCDFNLGCEFTGIDLALAVTENMSCKVDVIIMSEDHKVGNLVRSTTPFHFLAKPIKASRLLWSLHGMPLTRSFSSENLNE